MTFFMQSREFCPELKNGYNAEIDGKELEVREEPNEDHYTE